MSGGSRCPRPSPSPDNSFEREAVIDERAIYVDALRQGMGEMTYPEARASFEPRVAFGEFQEVDGDGHEAGRRFTTAATISAENEIVQNVRERQNRSPEVMSIESAVPLTELRSHLNAAQKRVVEEVLISRDRVQGVQGRGGFGQNFGIGNSTSAVCHWRQNSIYGSEQGLAGCQPRPRHHPPHRE